MRRLFCSHIKGHIQLENSIVCLNYLFKKSSFLRLHYGSIITGKKGSEPGVSHCFTGIDTSLGTRNLSFQLVLDFQG